MPCQLDRCHALRLDGPAVAKFYPRWHQPKLKGVADRAADSDQGGKDAMKIHEYQGKEIFRRFGMPVPRGYPAFTVDEAVEAAQKLGGPVWVVKAQIHAGGRGKGGGVKVAQLARRGRAARRRDPRHAARHAPDRARQARRCAAC